MLKTKFLNSLPFLGLIVSFYLILKNGIFYSSFNIDEVILFLSSQSDSIVEVFQKNRSGGSMDPGGFTLLLHYWGLVSTKTYWLRFLPFSFAIISCFLLFLSFKKIFKNSILATIPICIFLLSETLLNHSFQLRPYSMEFCGHAFIFYLFTRLIKIKEESTLSSIVTSMILIFFLSSRYLLWFDYFALMATLLATNKQRWSKTFLIHLIVPGLAIAVLFFTSLRYQLQLESVSYLNGLLIFHNGVEHLFKNFLSLPFFSFLVFPIHFMLKKNKESEEFKYTMYFSIYLASLLLLDLLKISPLNVASSYTLGIHLLGIASITLLIHSLFKEGLSKNSNKIIITLCLTMLFLISANGFYFKQRSNIVVILKYIQKNLTHIETISVDNNSLKIIHFMRDKIHYNINWSELPTFSADVQQADVYMRTTLLEGEHLKRYKDLIPVSGCHFQQLFIKKDLIRKIPNELCLK